MSLSTDFTQTFNPLSRRDYRLVKRTCLIYYVPLGTTLFRMDSSDEGLSLTGQNSWGEVFYYQASAIIWHVTNQKFLIPLTMSKNQLIHLNYILLLPNEFIKHRRIFFNDCIFFSLQKRKDKKLLA